MSRNNKSQIEHKKVFTQLKQAFDANPKLKNVNSFLTRPILKALPCELGKPIELPLFSACVPAGVASSVDDHIDQHLDLNHHLIKRPASTFLVRVEGDSMTGIGIYNHDILVVDRSVKPIDGKIVVAVIDNEFTVKRLQLRNKAIVLLPENPDFKPICITENMDFKIWGIVLHAIRTF